MDTPMFLFFFLLSVTTAADPVTVTVQPTPPLATVPPGTPVNPPPLPPATVSPPAALLPPATVSPPAALLPPTTVSPPAAATGQSWCVAKSGAPTTTVQAALDYACGAGAECSAIAQGGSCYNPNGLQSHASYAFNSYYQKHSRQATSCDFKGAAMITSINPSSGSCVYQTLSSSTSPTTSSSTGLAAAPTGFNGTTGSQTSSSSSSISMSTAFIGCIILLTYISATLDI